MSTLGKRKYAPPSSKRSAYAQRSKRGRLAVVVRSNVPRPMPGLPKTAVVDMTYCIRGALSSSSGTLGRQVMRANSIFDPDSTGVGHQALGHDQWAALYKNYVVLSSECTVEFLAGASQTVASVCGVYLSPEPTLTATTYEELIEQGKSNWTSFPPSAAVQPIRRYCRFDAKKDFNVKDVSDNVARIGAAFSANPSDQAYFAIWCQSIDQSSTTAVNAIIHVRYKVLMSEPTEIAQS